MAGHKLLPNAGHRNLKPGSKKGSKRKPYDRPSLDPKVKGIARRFVDNPQYRAMLREKMKDGTLHPSVQVMLWQYAYGRPKEEVEVKPIVPVTIRHEYE